MNLDLCSLKKNIIDYIICIVGDVAFVKHSSRNLILLTINYYITYYNIKFKYY